MYKALRGQTNTQFLLFPFVQDCKHFDFFLASLFLQLLLFPWLMCSVISHSRLLWGTSMPELSSLRPQWFSQGMSPLTEYLNPVSKCHKNRARAVSHSGICLSIHNDHVIKVVRQISGTR